MAARCHFPGFIRSIAAFAIGVLAFPLAGCAAAPNPMEWLRGRPFLAASDWTPPVVSENLPAGFRMSAPESSSEATADGSTVRIVRVFYQLPTGGQVASVNEVAVFVVGFSSSEARNAFLETMIPDTMEGEFVQAGGQQIVRFHGPASDLRMWVSGPYLIAIQSALDPAIGGRNTWVDAFAELYIQLYPARADGMPASATPDAFDWLLATMFVPAPDWAPPVILTGFPEGFQIEGSSMEWESPRELPEGRTMRSVSVQYSRPAGDGASSPNEVYVQISGFSDPAGRAMGILMLGGEESSESLDWEYADVGGEHIAGISSPYHEAYVWIAGPYLLMVAGPRDPNVSEHNPWIDRFAELYLRLYPPRADLALPSPTPLYGPLTWLKEAPFLPAPEGVPPVVTDNLPEGFTMLEPEPIGLTTSDGYAVRGVRVDYQMPGAVPDAVIPYQVEVLVFGFSEQAGRDSQLSTIPVESLGSEFVTVAGQRVARFYLSSTDVRIWVSGPYLLMIGTADNPSPTERDPRVDLFTGRYLELYPSR